ncbi:hypothetical protein ACWD4B_26975 [Streptomyces sp. NPDC002536]
MRWRSKNRWSSSFRYFKNKRSHDLAIIEDSVAELVVRAAPTHELPPAERVQRTVDGYLRYAQHHQAAYRAIVTGGVGFDAEVLALREGVTLDWLNHQGLPREVVCSLLVRGLGDTLRMIEDYAPECPAPARGEP